MFNNTTDIFIDTLASLQKIDDLEQLINPNSAFFQSYRNTLNEINLNNVEEGSINELSKAETKQTGNIEQSEPRFIRQNIPSLECLPSSFFTTKPARLTPTRDKENDTEGGRKISEQIVEGKPGHNYKPGFTRLEPLAEKNPEQISKFSFQKVENIKNTQAIKTQTQPVSTFRCTCTNSRCLKLYCACFSSGGTCGPQCQCKSCYNNEENDSVRKAMIEETLQKNPNAFQSKYKKHMKKGALLHTRGCNCSKTGCIKEYCECFKIGTGCTRLCHCVNCLNKKIDLQTDEVQDYYVKAIRKRRKTKIYEEKFGSNRKKIANNGKRTPKKVETSP